VEVESHVATCEICAAELAVHRSVAGGLSFDEPAPSAVWQRIAAEIAVPDASSPVTSLDRARRRPERNAAWLVSIAAIVVLVLGLAAIFQAVTNDDLTGPEAVIAAAEAAAEEPGSVVAEFTTESGSVGRVVLTSDGEGYVIPSELETLGTDRTYQLWVITPEEVAISAGVLGNEPGPSRFTWTDDVAGFALTREVAGGVVSSAGDVVSVVEL
jgi:anti-sigma-K factor RskA